MAKPDEVFDRRDEWDDLARFVLDPTLRPLLGVVSGRRRQGKTFLLSALADMTEGLYFLATEATAADSLRELGAAVAAFTGAPGPIHLASWSDAVDTLLDLPVSKPTPVVIDEFPYLGRTSAELPSVLQAALDRRRRRNGSPVRLLLCGSALTFMGKLLGGGAPLRGRAGLELVIPPLDFRLAAEFWGLDDPSLAIKVHSIVGGTPAYRREYVRDDSPRSRRDFDSWVARAVLSPASPLFREARYLLAEESDIREPALYHSVLAAIADGNTTRGGIGSYVGRQASEISHPLSVLEDAGLVAKEQDALRTARPLYRIAEPLISFYQAIMRPSWRDLERRRGPQVWQRSQERYRSGLLGPHFESLCRAWAADYATEDELGGAPGAVGHGVVNDVEARTSHQLDVVVLAEPDGERRRVLSIGEAKWNQIMGVKHLDRLQHIARLLDRRGYETSEARLACYSGRGFTSDLVAKARRQPVLLVDPVRLYG